MRSGDFLLYEPQQARAHQALQRILEAGRTLLATDGLSAVTTDEVARLAAVNISTFYKYFRNREALLGYLALEFSDFQTQSLLSCIAGFPPGLSWRDAVPALIDTMVADWARLPGSRALQGVFLTEPRLQEEYGRSSLAVAEALRPFADGWGFSGTEADWQRLNVVFGDCATALLDRAAKAQPEEQAAIVTEMKRLAIAYHACWLSG